MTVGIGVVAGGVMGILGGASVNKNSSLSEANLAMTSSNIPDPVPFSDRKSGKGAIGGIEGMPPSNNVETVSGPSLITILVRVCSRVSGTVELTSLSCVSRVGSSSIGSGVEEESFKVSALRIDVFGAIVSSCPSRPAMKKKSAKAVGIMAIRTPSIPFSSTFYPLSFHFYCLPTVNRLTSFLSLIGYV